MDQTGGREALEVSHEAAQTADRAAVAEDQELGLMLRHRAGVGNCVDEELVTPELVCPGLTQGGPIEDHLGGRAENGLGA